jgi:hypothetical protein
MADGSISNFDLAAYCGPKCGLDNVVVGQNNGFFFSRGGLKPQAFLMN